MIFRATLIEIPAIISPFTIVPPFLRLPEMKPVRITEGVRLNVPVDAERLHRQLAGQQQVLRTSHRRHRAA